MTHENYGEEYGLTLAKSSNGVNWEFVLLLATDDIRVAGQSCFFIDNDDPTDFNNIHVIGFMPTEGYFYEKHPLNSSFTEWSDWVMFFDTGNPKVYNCEIILVDGVYHMYYSRYDTDTGTHYMFHATCTYDPFLATNDWANQDVGDWSGLGTFVESMSLINLGGSNWVMYFMNLNAFYEYQYTLSDDNCATFDTAVSIYSLSSPLNYSAGLIKLK
jgi:hypothetical protein